MKFVTWRLLFLFVLPHVVFLGIALLTRNVQFIGVLNIVNFAVAVMVTVAYAPVVIDVLIANRPIDRADWLGMGVYLSWSSTIMLRAYSMVWRWLGQPPWLTDSDILSYALFVQLCAGILHLAAPGVINQSVPTRRWINIGIVLGITVFVALIMGYFFDALALPFDPRREQADVLNGHL